MDKTQKAHLLLLLTAFLWGTSFAAQSAGMNFIGPFSFNAARYLVGALFLAPFIARRGVKFDLSYLRVGGLLGLVLFVSSSLQQIAIQNVSAGKAGFITSLYIILVPILSQLVGKKVSLQHWIAVFAGLVGLYFMSYKSGGSIQMGDILLFIGAFGFSVHIILIERLIGELDPLAISATQFLTAAILSLACALFKEQTTLLKLMEAAGPILYVGIFSCGIAYTLQIVAQKDSDATVASIIFSLEAVFSVIAGAIFLEEYLSVRELIGCGVLLAAALYVQYVEFKQASQRVGD